MHEDGMPDDLGDDKPRKRKPHEVDAWYKRYPKDFYDDTRELKPDERGLYNDIVDLIYMAGGPLKDDERSLAYKMHVDIKLWRRIRKRLLAGGWLFIIRGHLHNKRAKEILATREAERRSMGRRGQAKPYVQGNLFENPNDINVDSRASSPDQDQSDQKNQKEDQDRSFEPRVIDGGKSRPALVPRYVTEDALDKVKDIAPGYDRQELLRRYMRWEGSKKADNPDAAFLGWVRGVVERDKKKRTAS